MKIFFDARFIRTDFHDGISRFSTELAHAFAKLTPVTFIISDPKQLNFLPANAEHVRIHPPASILEPFTAMILNKYDPDVVFSPLQTMGGAGKKFKLILTSHDMIYYRFRTPPRHLSPVVRMLWRLYHLGYGPQRRSLNRADMVATVSATSQREFENARLTSRPIVIIPNAPQDLKRYVKKIKSDVPTNLVYMGSFMPYKNVETLITGMQWLPGYTLHLLSRIDAGRQRELEALIPPESTVMFHNGVTDDTYARLLADNGVLVTASRYEGYGLPVAEALALGVPAVVSDLPIFHEVAAGGALYFDPNDPQDFADQVKKLENKRVRDEVIASGTLHIRTFNWQTSAMTLLNAIKSLV